jgi:nitric oxide reductase subunit C
VSSEASQAGFWDRCCGGGAKCKGLACLLLCFVIQTALVYSDSTREPPLEGQALEGRRLWHAKGCQVCHQVYGYGGFLGPDLTNAAPRVTRARLELLLTEGAPPMPAFHLSTSEIDAVEAYLRALDRTGRGQARPPREEGSVSPARAQLERDLDALSSEASPSARGLTLFRSRGCMACHVLLGRSPVGAPELTTVRSRLDAEGLALVLSEGRPPRMPAPGLSESERAEVTAFLDWLDEHASKNPQPSPPMEWSQIPWWEFK